MNSLFRLGAWFNKSKILVDREALEDQLRHCTKCGGFAALDPCITGGQIRYQVRCMESKCSHNTTFDTTKKLGRSVTRGIIASAWNHPIAITLQLSCNRLPASRCCFILSGHPQCVLRVLHSHQHSCARCKEFEENTERLPPWGEIIWLDECSVWSIVQLSVQIVRDLYKEEQLRWLNAAKERGDVALAGDGKCDSPGVQKLNWWLSL